MPHIMVTIIFRMIQIYHFMNTMENVVMMVSLSGLLAKKENNEHVSKSVLLSIYLSGS